MQVDGVRTSLRTDVILDEFFDAPTKVTVKALGPYARAKIREIIMTGFSVSEVDTKGKASGITTKPEGMADREMKQREIKLQSGFVSCDIKSGGVIPPWDKELWDTLDELNPVILERVIDAIDVLSKEKESAEGKEANPT